MIAIRKTWWAAAIVLAAFAGCGEEEPQGANPLPGPPPATGPAPGMPPGKVEEPKPAPGAEAPKASEPAKEEAPKIEAPKGAEPAKEEAPKEETKKEAAAKTTLSSEELAHIKKLSAADQELALKQLVCPVSGENLGSMDTPIKVSAEGRSFLLCCKGCEKGVKADPKGVLAKLGPQ